MRTFWPALLLWLASIAVATAGWKVVSSERADPPNEKLEHRVTVVENSETDSRATLHFALFNPKAATIRVVDQAREPRADLATAMEKEQALAGVNGGYFDPQDAPVGLLVSGGRKIASLGKAKLLSGVLWATGTRVDISRLNHFKMNSRIRNAVQCGPLLLENARPVSGLNSTRSARRTFAAVDESRHAILGVCSRVSLADLGEILSLTNITGPQKLLRALNLDGGSSSAFWIADGGSIVSEEKTVRDFVAIVPRTTR
jgi:exopolysaccharide biosynthesis protein